MTRAGRPWSVGVLGGGAWGLALATAASRAGSPTLLFSRRSSDASQSRFAWTHEFAELAAAKLILVAVPSHLARAVLRELGDHLDGSHVLVHGVRGLVGSELATISQVVREETPVRRCGALGGPVQADELADGSPSAMVVASEFAEVTNAVRARLECEHLTVYETSDLRGVEWASALVGCLSIGVGYAQARRNVSAGMLAALISRAVDEAVSIALAAGATEARTFYGLAGYGDLLASMALPNRPEIVLGRALARGETLELAREQTKLRVEAIELVPRVTAFAKARGLRCDVFEALTAILDGTLEPASIVRSLFAH
ncbi:MAG: glycerol-3-phosphate dehydrogenase [Myxococcales bacterium]|nr:glycerol-3-phosphate dehydrogenase [Myxococcales bacterium]